MSRGILRYTTLLCSLFVLASIGGVFATWHYAYGTVANVKEDLSVSLSEFEWKPDEILPTESEIGENHLALIELILNENKKGYGLNYDNKHVLEEYLENHRIIFSNQKVTGGNLKFVSDETNQLYYCVEKISDTMYYAYTFSYPDLNSVKGTTTVMPVYRTVLEKTDVWRATRSYFGYAQTKSLRNFGTENVPGTLAYSIDVTTWTSGG